MSKIKVIAAIVDTEQLTLYKENGDTYVIPQGDPRLRPILDQVTPILAKRDGSKAEVDVSMLENNDYADFQKKSSGIVKFFRVAKNFVKHIFAEPAEHVAPITLGTTEPVLETTQEQNITQITHAVEDIMANAKPVDEPGFLPSQQTKDETVIAVVDNKIIPGMENLQKQFAYATKLGSTIGVENFLKRLSSVIDKRGHSVDDLLRFLEKADLPIADDGCFIAYKRLRRSGSNSDVFVDCHSGNVKQRLGSYVIMDESMVDANRRRDCSNGLHIARRDYLGSFSGDVMVLCKIAPEDAIAVPQYSPSKIRVCAYHIIDVITGDEVQKLINNRSMTGTPKAQEMIGKAIKGQHIGKIEEVRITGSMGGGLKITQLAGGQMKKSQKTTEAPKAEALFDEHDKQTAPVVDPKAVAKEATEAATLSPKEQARKLFNEKNYAALIAFKKTRKVGWAKLGFNEQEAALIENDFKPIVVEKQTKKPVVQAKKTKGTKVENTNTYTSDKPVAEMNREEKARHHFMTATVNKDKSGWTALWLLKKQAKKSFQQLGFTDKEVERINTNKPDHV